MRFDFNEANILQQTFYDDCSKSVLLNRLDSIARNTNEQFLKRSVFSLIEKIRNLSDWEIRCIRQDISKKRFVVTSNYKVLHQK